MFGSGVPVGMARFPTVLVMVQAVRSNAGARGRVGLVAVVVPVVVAIAASAHQLTRPYALAGTSGYDDGVYMGGALLLWRGVLPYADFTFLHPPGILLALAPPALLSHVIGESSAFVVARLLTAAAGVASVAMASLVVRRHGPLAMFSAGIVLATFPAAVAAVRTVTLEPWMVLPALAALTVLFDSSGRVAGPRRQVAAGALLGVALLVKLWVAAVVLAVLGVVWFAAGRRAGVRVATAAAVVFGVPMVWFALVSGGDALAQVVGAQAGRERTGTWALPLAQRLSAITGHTYPTEPAPSWLAPVILVFVVGLGATIWLRRRALRAVDTTVLTAAALMVLAVLVAPQFYPYYPYFPFVGLSLVAGTWVGLLASRPTGVGGLERDPPVGSGGPGRLVPVGAVAALVLLGVVVLSSVNLREAWATNGRYLDKAGPPPAVLTWGIPPGSCVAADGYTPLILADRFIDGHQRCRIEVDPFGDALFTTGASPSSPTLRFDDPLVVSWRERMLAADAVVMVGPYSSFLPWPDGQRAWFDERFIRIPADGAAVYVKR